MFGIVLCLWGVILYWLYWFWVDGEEKICVLVLIGGCLFVLIILVFESWVGWKEGVLVVFVCYGVDGNVGEVFGWDLVVGEVEGWCNVGVVGYF